MLCKELCKKCYNENRSRPWDKHRKHDKQTGEVYVQKDRTWARGIMFCVALMDSRTPSRCQIKVANRPPDCCYYLVEQLMLASRKSQNPEAAVQ